MTMNHHQPSKLTTTGSSQVRLRLKLNRTRLKQLMLNKVRPFSLQAVIKYFLSAFWDGSTKDIMLIVSLTFNLILGKKIYMNPINNFLVILLLETTRRLRKERNVRNQNLELMNRIAGSSTTVFKND